MKGYCNGDPFGGSFRRQAYYGDHKCRVSDARFFADEPGVFQLMLSRL